MNLTPMDHVRAALADAKRAMGIAGPRGVWDDTLGVWV